MSLWGRNTNMPASYIIQQNQNRAVYTDFMTQQQKITQGCQKTNRIANVTSVNSNQIIESVKENEQDQPCNEDMKCCISGIVCPLPEEQPYVPGPGQAQWANRITVGSTTSTQSSVIYGTTTDSAGNVFISGAISSPSSGSIPNFPIYDYVSTSSGQINLIPSSTVLPLELTTLNLSTSAFLAKYNKDGIAQWAVNFDGVVSGTPSSIVTDNAGNVYMITIISRTAQLTIKHMSGGSRIIYGTIAAAATNQNDLLIIKYNTNGTAQRVSICTSSSSGSEAIQTQNVSIAISPPLPSDQYLAYIFRSTQAVTINNGAIPATPGGAISFTSAATINPDFFSQNYIIIVTVNASNLNMARATKIGQVGGNISNSGSISCNNNGNIVVSIETNNSGTINLNVYNSISSGGTIGSPWGIFSGNDTNSISTNIIKYDNTLTPQAFTAIKNQSGLSQETARGGVVFDTSGNIYYVGSSIVGAAATPLPNIEFLSFSNLSGTTINTTSFCTLSVSASSAYIIKYNSNLQIQNQGITTISSINTNLTKQINPFGIAIDSNNNIYIGASFTADTYTINSSNLSGPNNSVTVTPYANITNVTPVNAAVTASNVVLIKYNSQLQVQWATTLTCNINQNAQGFSLYYSSIDNSIYVGGGFSNYNGELFINNTNSISGGNLNTELYATLTGIATGLSLGQTSGFLVKYFAS